MPWLTSTSVRDETDSKVREIKEKIERRRRVTTPTYEHEQIAKIVGESLGAGIAILREWFCDSVGMSWGGGDHNTFYISRAPVASTFAEYNVVHWTHWLGRLSTQIREYIDINGCYPVRLVYGPPHMPQDVLAREVGPWIRYKFIDGRLVEYSFRDAAGTVDLATESPSAQAPGTEAAPQSPEIQVVPVFGLKDIVELRDLDQDDQIRGLMAGVYILTGGPGVGKTSVALHRIPYLLLQQAAQLPAELPSAPTNFFSTDSMQVVVWKEHLVPYLQQCLRNLHYGSVAVLHVEDWVARALRDYVRIGKGKDQYQITPVEPKELRRIKIGGSDVPSNQWQGFTEQMIGDYLTGRNDDRSYNPLADEAAATLAELTASLEQMFAQHPIRPSFRTQGPRVMPTVAGVEFAVQALRDNLDRLERDVAESIRRIDNPGRRDRGIRGSDSSPYRRMRPVIAKARETISTVRDSLVERITADYPAVLADFYASPVANRAVAERFGQMDADMFSKTASEHITNRRLSQCDRYLLLWVIHLLTRGASSDRRQGRPLRQYSHTVIDEAQYYHPLVLRLLVDLAMPPLRSVTIVGDLEQKVSNDGGLVGWEDAGITVEAGKIFRLNTNYRWSQAVFSFLDKYRRLAGLRELKEPRRWASGAGLKPVVVRCGDEDREASWLVDRIAEVRRKDWSIAVVVPPGLGEDWRQRVIGELASCDIRSRWATGEDVRECQEQIILTNYESIVGLEFDAVFLPGCDRVLIPPAPGADSVQAAWVALTRSRQFVAVSHIGPVAIFSNGEFDHYRSEAT